MTIALDKIKHCQQWPLLIILSVLGLLPFGRGSEFPLLVGAITAIAWLWRGNLYWRTTDSRIHLFGGLFAGYWLAAFFSGSGAVFPEETWTTILSIFRFAPYGLFCILSINSDKNNGWTQNGIAYIILFWLADAWFQIFTGYSLGGPVEKERLSGIFSAKNLKLGPVLAVLSPFVLLWVRERFGRLGLAIIFLLLLVPILLAGSRASWISFSLVCVIFVWRETRALLRFLLWISSISLTVLLMMLAARTFFPGFDARIERSLLALHGTHEAIDDAAAGRLRIWHTAWEMGRAHPLTGVGVRGFRYSYANYSQPGDGFIDTKTREGASHAHQLLLELWSETGIIGLLCWIIAASLAIAAWWRADAITREHALAPTLALLAMCFPLNTHFAFYSAWWGLLFWWLLALYCATIRHINHRTLDQTK